MEVLDKGLIGLDEMMGSDRKIARMAWVSYGKQDSDRPIEGVINYMMEHKHGTPFEHVVFTWYVKAPIFVAREWMRHRMGSFNEISGRYVKLEPEFYIPEHFRAKGGSNKQGSVFPDEEWFKENWSSEEDLDDNIFAFDDSAKAELTEAYDVAYNAYLEMLGQGVANEVARIVLPLATYSQWFWTVNLRALFNFMNLRSAENAQWEIRQYSQAIESQVKELVPVAYAAWEKNGRNAP